MDLDTLYQLVTAGILRANELADDGESNSAANLHVSILEECISGILSGTSPEGVLARRGAVRAAVAAGDLARAEILVTRFSAEKDVGSELRQELLDLLGDAQSRRRVTSPSESEISQALRATVGIVPVEGLGSVAAWFWRKHVARLLDISLGSLTILDQDETVECFVLLSRSAKHSIMLVDFIDIKQWRNNKLLHGYLSLQMSRIKPPHNIKVERVRFVPSEDLADTTRRGLLKQFLDLHENSGADLLLCPYEEGQRLNSGFFPRMGFQLIDKEDDLACVTSWLNDDGYIERSDLYLNEHPRVEECYNGFLWLQDQIRRGGLHREVTDKLNDSDTKGLAPWDTPAASRGQHPVAPIGRLRAL